MLENPDRFAIRLTEQISSIGLFAVTESHCTEDEDDDEDDSKFRNFFSSDNPGINRVSITLASRCHRWQVLERTRAFPGPPAMARRFCSGWHLESEG